MATPAKAQRDVTVDEDWLSDWVAWGIAELERVLALHALFVEWLEAHGQEARE